MKTFQAIIICFAAIIACTTAFTVPATVTVARPAFKTASLAMSKMSEEAPVMKANPNAAALAAFATALAPLAAHATDIDEGVVIGYGAGLVACVVSLAVGFSIGYGTLVKP